MPNFIFLKRFPWFQSNPRKVLFGINHGITMNIDLSYQTQLFLGLHESETHQWLKKLSKKAAVIIDIGAAEGEQTLYFLLKTNAHKIYAIEPDTNQFSCLKANLGLNPTEKKLNIITKFIGKQTSETHLTLDSMANEIHGHCFIKMDIEGAEIDALLGAQEILKSKETSWLIETHSLHAEQECLKILSNAGYKTIILRNAWWRLFIPEHRPLEHNRWLVAYKKLPNDYE